MGSCSHGTGARMPARRAQHIYFVCTHILIHSPSFGKLGRPAHHPPNQTLAVLHERRPTASTPSQRRIPRHARRHSTWDGAPEGPRACPACMRMALPSSEVQYRCR